VKKTLLSAGLLASLLFPILTCDSPQNPFNDPGNVEVRLWTTTPPDSAFHPGDSVRLYVRVILSNVTRLLVVSIADSVDSLGPTVPDTSVFVRVFADTGHYPVLASALRNDGVTVSAGTTIVVTPQPARPCEPVALGASLNQAIRAASSERPKKLCPEPGLYEQGTLRVFGTVRFVIE
jgi:hypothetical protein